MGGMLCMHTIELGMYFYPDGVLFQFPFHSNPIPNDDSKMREDYLIELVEQETPGVYVYTN